MIQCYNCNQWKSGEVAPFAICDDCKGKAGVQSEPAKQQKSFIEMERPRRTTEFVVIVKRIEAGQTYGNCQQMVEHGLCGNMAGWNCMICGCWTCNNHADNNQGFDGSSICESCGMLSREDRERVYELREALNQQ